MGILTCLRDKKRNFILLLIWLIYMLVSSLNLHDEKHDEKRKFQKVDVTANQSLKEWGKLTEKLSLLKRKQLQIAKLIESKENLVRYQNMVKGRAEVRQVKTEFPTKLQPCNYSSLPLLGVRGTSKNIFDVINDPPNIRNTIRANPRIFIGGRYSPEHCKAKYKVAIIIPFRGRESQLQGLLAHMHPIWQRQQIDYTVYTATEAGNDIFNKGKLMNAGFLEASKDRDYDCYVFHDVDLLLDNDECLYWCPPDEQHVIHLPYLIDKFGFRDFRYEPRCLTRKFRPGPIGYFGGATMFTAKQFRDINGFSNLYWGWGGEDDDVQLRVRRKGYIIRRNAKCQYRMFRHDHDKGNEINQVVGRLLNVIFERQDNEGLNSAKYKVISKNLLPLYTNITIDVGTPLPDMREMFANPKEYQNCNGTAFLNPKYW